MTLHCFIGYDTRQPVAFTVAAQSIIMHAKQPVAIHPLVLSTLPIARRGLTEFTYSRFLVPWLMEFEGRAMFVDGDVLIRADIGELFHIADASEAVRGRTYAVHVVKGPQRFEWPAVMLFNCWHYKNQKLKPEFVETTSLKLHWLEWLADDEIGELPAEWAHTILYDPPRPDAKLVHYTAGLPAFPELASCEHGKEWDEVLTRAITTVPWNHLMGRSVHAERVVAFMKGNGSFERLGYRDPKPEKAHG